MSVLSIPSPNTDRSLLTLPELRAAAGVKDSSQDAALTAMGNYVSAMITSACKVARAGAIPPTLRLESVVETFRFKSQQKNLILARRPVVEITSVSSLNSALDVSEYECEEAAGLLTKLVVGGGQVCWPIGDVVVSYSAGFAVVPDDLKYAAMKFVQAERTNAGRDPTLKRLTIDGVSTREWWVEPKGESIVPADVMDILVRGGYANMVIA